MNFSEILTRIFSFLKNPNPRAGMDLALIRRKDDHKRTTGELFIDAILFSFTLEDTFRHEKIDGETRIPAGRYPIVLRKNSPMADKYQKRFGTNGMLWLKGVPGFKYVYIHIGNDEDDTEGCILVGGMVQSMIKEIRIDARVLSSTEAYIELWEKVNAEMENDRPVFISVFDN